MADENITGVSQEARRKRINRLKKMIVTTIVVGISLPLVLCVFMLIRMNRLEKLVEEMKMVVETELSVKELPDNKENALVRGEDTLDVIEVQTEQVGTVTEEDIPEEPDDAKEVGQVEENGDSDTKAEVEVMTQKPAGDTESIEDMINVYLTFDDGPSIYTEDILDILDEYGVKASFFVLAKDKSMYDDAYRAIVDRGHTLGMHSYTHVYEEIYSGLPAFMEDVTSIQNFIYEKTGVFTNLYRFPGGSSNSYCKNTLQQYLAYLEDKDILYFDWNISSQDATGKILTKEQIAENVLSKIHKYKNCVVLMHDAASKKTTVEALPLIIEGIQAMGNTRILPIDETTELIQHRTKSK